MATRFHIHYNVPSEVYNVTDTGRLRGLDDVAFPRFHGHKKAAALSKAMATVGLNGGSPKVSANLPLMRVFQEQHQDSIAFTCDLFKTHKRGITAPVQAAVARAYYYMPRHELALFVDRLYTGVTAEEGEAAVVLLRNWLMSDVTVGRASGVGGGGSAQEKYLKAARALQLFRERKPVASLRAASADPFPLPSLGE
jgi:hypothetical protein